VQDGALEFGSILFFSHSWASIGNEKFINFELEFRARFVNPQSPSDAWIGVGLRSQHYFANYAHLLYIKGDGSIWITEPNEQPPSFYKDVDLRPATPMDLSANHRFRVDFGQSRLIVEIDDFSHCFELAHMPKLFGPGFIRFQSSLSRMAISTLKLIGR